MNQPPEFDKEVIPAEWAELPVFSASQLRVTPPRTAADIQHDIREGRVSEMTPGLAGY
jgi:hypothetical protein